MYSILFSRYDVVEKINIFEDTASFATIVIYDGHLNLCKRI